MTYCNKYLEKIAQQHDDVANATIGGGIGFGAGLAADYIPDNYKVRRFLPNSKLTGAVGGAVSNVISGRIGDAVLKKQAADVQDLNDYAADYTSYQEPILKNVLTGSSVGGFSGTMMAFPKVVDKVLEMKTNANTPEQLAKATQASGRIMARYGRVGALAGAGAGLAWGVKAHLQPHREHVANNSHIDGVVEYSKRHIDPRLGAFPSAAAGGYLASKLSSKIPLPAHPILGTAISMAPAILGAVAGEKLGVKGMDAYNNYVLNDVKSKYYQ